MNTDRLKFRVWDTERKIYTTTVEHGWKFPFAIREDGRIGYLAGYGMDQFVYGKEGRYIIEQCTGLKDKNGNMIFEGDILEVTFSDKSKIQQTVIWDSENARFVHTIPRDKYNFSPLIAELCAKKEIIGNIHDKETTK